MESILLAILSNNNVARAAAEKQFTEAKLAFPRDVLSQLSSVLQCSSNESYRSLSAILLRGIVLREPEMWGSLTNDEFEYVRNQLLESLMKEEIGHIQRKIANAVATHAKIKPWPALIQGVVQLSSSTSVKHHELCLFLLDKLAENIGPLLISNLDVIMDIILPFLLDRNSLHTRIFAAQALCSVLFEVPEINPSVCDSLQYIPFIISQAVEEEEDSYLQEMLSNLCRLCKEHSEMFISSWEKLFQSIQVLCVHDRIEGGSKVIALDIIVTLLTSRKSTFCSTEKSRKECLHLCMKLMTVVDEEDESISSSSRPESEESGFGDVDGDGGDGNISDFAAVCVDTLSKSIEPSEIVQTCMMAAWGMVNQADWRARRVALLVVSVICEGARDSLFAHLKALVPTVVQRVSDPHPRVRFIAIHCLETLINEFTGQDDDDEDEVQEPSFQDLFKDIPTVLCQSVQSNFTHPRIVYGGLSALKSFFNPDVCPKKICEPFGGDILDFCLILFRNTEVPMFVRAECASVMGNVSILYSEKLSTVKYHDIVENLKITIFNPTQHENENEKNTQHSHEHSLLKAKCLESVALLGKAVGSKIFSPDAHEFLKLFVESHQKGMDFSDPLSSYIVQTCARIAGVIGEEFQPYVAYFIPPLLVRIAQEIDVQVSEQENCFLPQGTDRALGGGNSADGQAGKEVFTVYKRGIGNVNVVCNTHEIGEKETACRCLYQYCHDIPQFLWQYSNAIVQATAPLLASQMHKSDDLFIIVGAIVAKCMKMHLLYSTVLGVGEARRDTFQTTESWSPQGLLCIEAADSMTRCALDSMCISIQQSRNADSPDETEISSSLITVENINDLLKARHSITLSLSPSASWPVTHPLEGLRDIVIALRSIAMQYVQRRFVDLEIPSREEDEKTEDDLWSGVIDAIGWLIKLFGDRIKHIIAEEMIPFIHGLLTNPENPAMLMLLPICVLLDVVEYMPSYAEECSALIAPSLFQYISHSDVTVPCIFGLGVCAVHGGAGFDPHCGQAVSVLLGAAGADSEAARTLDLDEELDQDIVKDNAYSSLFKISVYRSHVMQAASAQLLQFCFQNMPLNGDVSEARAVHQLFVQLLTQRDLRLLGAGGRLENLSQVLFILAQLAAVDDEAKIEQTLIHTRYAEDDEFWEKQIVSARTLHLSRTVLKDAFGVGGIPAQILQPAVESLPQEIQSVLHYFSTV